ncbi:hypothetical protein VCUG_01664 [Vavraia culicis subsp. floridensis]|uniref:Uncharacterized protein n=1 Tax=Vavraia culicis (isolate floridensis) TaxID=948595 RepID=L2GUP1_VAVCU|nr:uncharacterized protein VCUG_01664 [Vavraia culicis subsp. floridensis]ELA46820.1 hypothetical protein VCUG_01664 [Vavraia culicis subsp. floridensis]
MMRKESEVMRRKSFIKMGERYGDSRYMGYYHRECSSNRVYGENEHGSNFHAMAGFFASNNYEMRSKTKKSGCYGRNEGVYRVPRISNCPGYVRSHDKSYIPFNVTNSAFKNSSTKLNLPYTFFTLTNTSLQHRILTKLFTSPPQIFFQFTPFVLVIATIYIRRHSYHTGMYNNFMNFFFIGCCIAKKIWNDKVCRVESWMRIEERSALECHFCNNVDYDFIVSEKEFGWWMVMLCN